ncbi:MAG: phosphoribosylaminoimidazolecarboxamide formyltransferase [Deltaproteobacteria bacterium]|nr:phosphoribosylaminoimidazolecarboxamide formyltransferase [Deltaproteobacteria bacterium]
MDEIKLRYGCNPHQAPARVFARDRALPLRVLCGAPGYINLLDALNAWQLVRELRAALNLPAATSFKHVSPAGAAVAVPMSQDVRRASFVDDLELSPLATAYARARGADRLCSFGDFAAMSDVVDVSTANVLKREVSDGVIAPGYEPAALEILRGKRNGTYCVLEIDPAWAAPETESREVFGIVFEQRRNHVVPGPEHLATIVTKNRDLPAAATRDLILALITLKYTQSNSVCFAYDGQAIGIGAGQQSRIHCTRLAGSKADRWFLRQHPSTLALPFRAGLGRPEQNNAIDLFLEDALSPAEESDWLTCFSTPPRRLTSEEKRAWLSGRQGASLASDAFFPFRDNVDRAAQSGVKYISQPGGSVRDDAVIRAADEYGMVMAMSKLRLFHH